jgi:AraC family transcriptional regulator
MNSLPAHQALVDRPAVADYARGARLPARVIDDAEFVWMLRGQARLVTADADLRLSPGQLLLVPPGVRHAFVWDQERASRHGYVHFSPELIEPSQARRVQLRRMTAHDPLAGLCAHLLWLGREQVEGWTGHAGRTLRFLLTLFMSGPLPGDDAERELPRALAAVIDHLRRTWSQMPLRRVTVDELASAANVSRSYLNRLFQAEFGISAASALERLRCSRAETLLVRTDMTIGSIGHQCGFADPYHFSHRFTRLYGVAPSGYRRARGSASSLLDLAGLRRLTYLVWE